MAQHIVPVSTYYRVFAFLMIGLVLTVTCAQIEHDLLNTIFAITIASAKVIVILLYFMHVRYSSRMTQILCCAGFAWFFILIAFLAADYQTRGWPLGPTPQTNWIENTATEPFQSAP